MKYEKTAAMLVASGMVLSGCAGSQQEESEILTPEVEQTYTPSVEVATSDSQVDVSGFDLSTTNRDADASYDSVTATITFNNAGVSVDGSGVQVDGTTTSITQGGTYILTGTSSDANVIVNTADTEKVQLVFSNLDLTSATGAPIIIQQSDKVFITLAEGTTNKLSDASSYELTIDDSTVDGVIFSKEDLTINGTGALTINANYKHGIVSKDDLVVMDGTITINANNVGLEGKDCVKIIGGSLDITSGSDGIRASNTEDATRGFVWVAGGNVSITSGTDGIQGETLVAVTGGSVDVVSGEGSANASTSSSAGWGNWGTSTSTTESSSAKGIKATADIWIADGTINIDASDDAIHANDSILIQGGDISLASGDDGVHADATLSIAGGDLEITKSYEGLEAQTVQIYSGMIDVVASDDGINAAGGNDSSAVSGRPGQNNFASSTGCIVIEGGYTVVDAGGDGIDSNGSIDISGGVVLVSGAANNGNGAFDYDTTATISDGIVIALGGSGMAQSFSNSSTQATILKTVTTQQAGDTIALVDSSGTVLASFTAPKSYNSIVVSAPGMEAGGTYTIVNGKVQAADLYGFANQGGVSNSETLASVTLSGLHYSESGGGQARPQR